MKSAGSDSMVEVPETSLGVGSKDHVYDGRRSLQESSESEWTTTSDICHIDSHCLNNGKCLQPTTDIPFRHCQCQNNYSGPRCSRFCPFDCQNGGICRASPQGSAMGLKEKDFNNRKHNNQNNSDDYYCKCHGHFTGLLCEIPYTNCGEQSKRCYNGGRCVLDETSLIHHCSCPKGYGGQSCEDEYSTYGNNLEASSSSSDSSNIKGEGKPTTSFTVLSILLFFLGATLYILLRKKRLAVVPLKFITFEGEDDCHPPDDDEDNRSDGLAYYNDSSDTHSSGRIMLNVI